MQFYKMKETCLKTKYPGAVANTKGIQDTEVLMVNQQALWQFQLTSYMIV